MMWSTSGKSPLNQELIQAFIPSGHENGNSKEQSTVTIQTSLHQPDRESPVYLLQAQVQQHQHKLPGSDGAIVHVGESRPASFGSCRSLREREMQIREKLLRRNIHPPESEKPEETAVAKSEVRVSTRKRTSSIYQQRNNYLRKKLLDRPNGRDQPIPTQTRQKEEPRIASKEDSAHTSEDASPLLLPPFEGYEGIPGHPRPHGPAAPKKAAIRRSCEGPTADIPGKDEPGKVGRQPVASAGMGEFQRGKVRNCPEGSRFEESNQGIEMEVGP